MNNVSIILPSYNHRSFLVERLNSVLNQSYTYWSLIIIDDCSTDGSIELLESFYKKNKDKVSHFSINKTNSGSGYNSWKKGIELARSKYIWIAETDDFSHPSFLEEQIKVLDSDSSLALSFCASIYVDKEGTSLYTTDKRTSDLEVEEHSFKIFDKGKFL